MTGAQRSRSQRFTCRSFESVTIPAAEVGSNAAPLRSETVSKLAEAPVITILRQLIEQRLHFFEIRRFQKRKEGNHNALCRGTIEFRWIQHK